MATWVIGDVHGCFDDFIKMINHKDIQPEDNIILIGDIIDRGPNSYKMIQWAIEHVSQSGKYQMVCGNHEDNIINDFNRCKHHVEKRWCSSSVHSLADMDICEMHTDYDFTSYMYAEGFETVESVRSIVDWFKSLPLYKNVAVTNKNGQTKHYTIAHAWYGPKLSRDDIVWYRDINDFTNALEGDYRPESDEILVHGHTPTPIINVPNKEPSSDILIRDHSINIDCGCVFRQYGGKLAAIRLEDLYAIYV